MSSFVEDLKEELSVEHLSTEAIAALVDGELSPRATHRAKVHLVHCTECRREIIRQREAADRLREHAATVFASGNLIARLRGIPEAVATGLSDGEARRRPSEPGHFTVDGRRRPETISDRVDLLIRKVGRGSH